MLIMLVFLELPCYGHIIVKDHVCISIWSTTIFANVTVRYRIETHELRDYCDV